MLDYLLSTMIEITLSTSLIILMLLLLRPLLGKKYTVKWRYWIWLAIALRLLIPLNFTLPQAPLQIDPLAIAINIPATMNETVSIPSPLNVLSDQIHQTDSPSNDTMTFQQMAAMLWLSGTTTMLTYHFVGHLLFLRKIRRWEKKVTNQEIRNQFIQTLKQLGIRRNVNLKMSRSLSSPMLTGMLRPTVWIPILPFNHQELEVILKHELIHYKEGHLWYKFILLLTQSIHWFNPCIHIFVREANKDIELVCDSEVVKGKNMLYRKQYSEIILSMINEQKGRKTALSTHFNGGKTVMLQRFASILDTRRKSKGFGAILLFSLVLILSGILVACGSSTDNESPTNKESSAQPLNTNEPAPTDTPEITPLPSDGKVDHVVAPIDDVARDFLNSEDGQSLQAVARTFTEAYLSRNIEEMKKFLNDPESEVNEYLTENQMDNLEMDALESMTLKLSAASIREDMVLPSYELDYKDRDIYLYLSLEMHKTEDGWKIGPYYLEQ